MEQGDHITNATLVTIPRSASVNTTSDSSKAVVKMYTDPSEASNVLQEAILAVDANQKRNIVRPSATHARSVVLDTAHHDMLASRAKGNNPSYRRYSGKSDHSAVGHERKRGAAVTLRFDQDRVGI